MKAMVNNSILQILKESLARAETELAFNKDRIEYLKRELALTEGALQDCLELKKDLHGLINKYGGTEAARIIFIITEPDGSKMEVSQMFLKVSQKIKLGIEIKDKFGNPAQIDGKPVFALSDETLADMVVTEDGLSCDITPKGPVGALKVQAKCDADLGEGVKEILGELDLDLIAGEAVTVELKAGEPTDV